MKRWLDREGVTYETAPAEDHLDYIASLGYRSAPVVVHDGGHFQGFNPTELAKLK